MKIRKAMLLALAAVFICAAAAFAEPAFIALSSESSVTIKVIDKSAYTGRSLSFEILHWPDGASFSSGKVDASEIKADALGNPAFTIDKLSPKLWSPQTPELYTISIKDSTGKEIGSTRFGFRTFEVKDRKFYLNGKPIFLRVNPINPPGRDLPEATGKDLSFARGYIKLMKDYGVNMLRVGDNNWLDVCDELGMMTFQGHYGPSRGGSADQTPQLDQGKRFYEQMAAELASHPSVTVYVFTNEVNAQAYDSFLNAIHKDVELLDPTRPAIGNAGFGKGQGGDIWDLHRYSGWYYGNSCDWYDVSGFIKTAEKQNQPLTISECVAAYTTDAGIFQTVSKQMSTHLRWTGPVADQKTAALDYQAELTKQVVEITRRLRTENSCVAGVMPFTYFLGWASAAKPEDLAIKPCFETLKQVFQPVLISPECWKRNVYAGDTLQMRLCVVNDDDSCRDLSASKAKVLVVGSSGKVVASGSVDFSAVPYFSNAWKDFSVALPQNTPKGYYTVRLELVENGKTISTNSFEVTIAPRSWTKITAKAYVYDPSGKNSAALQKLGVQVTKLQSVNKLPKSGLVVIGEEALSSGSPTKSAVSAFLAGGGRLLCLRQTTENWPSDWLPADLKVTNHTDLTYVHPVGGNSALFAGLSDKDFRYWNELGRSEKGIPDISPMVGTIKPETANDLKSARLWALCDRGLSGAAVAEIFSGKGSVVLSQFRCVERAAGDPIAAKMLSDLVSYAAAPAHAEFVDLSKPINWGLAAFRSGVLASPVQGMMPHSPVYVHTGSSKGQLGADQAIDGCMLVGNLKYSEFGWVRPVPNPREEGWGTFFGRLSKPAAKFVLKAKNNSDSPANIRLLVDSKEIGSAMTFGPREVKAVEWQVNRSAGPVGVELRGDQDLVITESVFE